MRTMRTSIGTILTLALIGGAASACETRGDEASDTAQVAGDTASAAGTAGAASADPDNATQGGGLPPGYLGRGDRDASLSNVSYTRSGERWVIRTGTPHIIYAAGDTARGNYTATATIEQLAAPEHREAYGMFIGGTNLDQPSQRYTYFIVAGTGEYTIKVRDGAATRDIRAWTASNAVPKADASGRATYRITARAQGDSVRFLVNDQAVAAVARSQAPADGVVGLRINHNLHVSATPVNITRQ